MPSMLLVLHLCYDVLPGWQSDILSSPDRFTFFVMQVVKPNGRCRRPLKIRSGKPKAIFHTVGARGQTIAVSPLRHEKKHNKARSNTALMPKIAVSPRRREKVADKTL